MPRPRAPVEVRVASMMLYAIGAILLVLSLMATGVLLSGPEIDPVRQGGTGVLDLVLLFNAALCLLPVDALVIVLGRGLTRGGRWAWVTTLILCVVIVAGVLLAMYLLDLPRLIGGAVLVAVAGLVGLLGTRHARAWTAPRDTD
jgi:hypothetical protein